MKTKQDWIKEKTSYLEEAGTIPIEQAGVCWGYNDDSYISSGKPIDYFHVVDFRKALNHEMPESQLWDKSRFTDGACVREWKEGVNPRYTPLGKLAEHCYSGTVPKGAAFGKMLEEFAKIEGCEWALHMLAALHMGDYISPDGEEYRL